MSLVIIGSLAFDTIETPHGRREKIVGGSATYCALAASFFTQPKMVGVIGEDFPDETIELFKTKSIDTQGVEIQHGKTFHWEGRYGDDPNQRTTIKTDLNVLKNFRPQLPPSYRQADIVFLTNIDPDIQEEILAQVHKSKLIALDTIKFWIEHKSEPLLQILKRVDLLFANEEEVRMLANEINLVKGGKKLLENGPAFIIIKKGEHGALVLGRDFVFGVLGYPCEKVIDPTGAGDSFAGGFLGYLDRVRNYTSRSEIRKAAVFGSVLASYAIEDFGINRFKSLTSQEIKKRYTHFKKLISF
jgi:sugar/nucleoside kinase (ribokinase family)